MPTTDEMDRITPEERQQLVGYCESCEAWRHFTPGVDPEHCPHCQGPFSQQGGQQIITKRSFDPTKLKKPKKRR